MAALLLAGYVRASVAVGRFEEARRIVRRVPDLALRSAVLSHGAEALAKAGMTGDAASTAKEALNVAQQIPVNMGRSGALISVAFALAIAGKWAEADDLARQISDAPSRDAALSGPDRLESLHSPSPKPRASGAMTWK